MNGDHFMRDNVELIISEEGQILLSGIHDSDVIGWSFDSGVSLTLRGEHGDFTFHFAQAAEPVAWSGGAISPVIVSCMTTGPLERCLAEMREEDRCAILETAGSDPEGRWAVLVHPILGDRIIIHGRGVLEDVLSITIRSS